MVCSKGKVNLLGSCLSNINFLRLLFRVVEAITLLMLTLEVSRFRYFSIEQASQQASASCDDAQTHESPSAA